jgi:hypothetical protein
MKLPEARSVPSGDNDTEDTGERCPKHSCNRLASGSCQHRTLASSPPDASNSPSFENDNAVTLSSCAGQADIRWPDCKPKTKIQPFSAATGACSPLSETVMTAPRCGSISIFHRTSPETLDHRWSQPGPWTRTSDVPGIQHNADATPCELRNDAIKPGFRDSICHRAIFAGNDSLLCRARRTSASCSRPSAPRR